MKPTKFWLTVIGLALLLHIVLIILSILEVAIYSYLIEPGRDEAFYQAHAEDSGPWISGIFGFLLVYLLVRRFIRRNQDRHLLFTIGLPVIYVLMDILILLPFQIDWQEHLPVLLMANGAKLAGAALGYWSNKAR